MPVAEQDIERIGVLRRVASEEPPVGFEPLLHIRIPVDVDISDLKERGIVRIHYNGKPEIIDKDTKIDVDDKLMQFLSKPFPPQEKNWAVINFDAAQLDCSERMLITYYKDLLDEMLTELDITRKRKAKLYLIDLIKLHDGYYHVKTLIDPRMRTIDGLLPPPFIDFPLSIYWHELWAIVNEIKVLNKAKDDVSEFVKKKMEDVRTTKPEEDKRKIYRMIYDIIRFFENKGLTLNDMIKILKVPIKIAANPEGWLCYVLLDLAKGLDPTYIPYESSFYNVIGKEYDDRAELMKYRRKKILRDPITRMDESLYEVVVIGEDAIERRWFCLKPKPDIAEVSLKQQIFFQELYKIHAKKLIVTTRHPTEFCYLEYQKRRLSIEDLFRESMKGKISPEKLGSLFTLHYNSIKHLIASIEAIAETLIRMGIRDLNEWAKWVGEENSYINIKSYIEDLRYMLREYKEKEFQFL